MKKKKKKSIQKNPTNWIIFSREKIELEIVQLKIQRLNTILSFVKSVSFNLYRKKQTEYEKNKILQSTMAIQIADNLLSNAKTENKIRMHGTTKN